MCHGKDRDCSVGVQGSLQAVTGLHVSIVRSRNLCLPSFQLIWSKARIRRVCNWPARNTSGSGINSKHHRYLHRYCRLFASSALRSVLLYLYLNLRSHSHLASDTTNIIIIIQEYRTREHICSMGQSRRPIFLKAAHQALFAPVTDSHCEN